MIYLELQSQADSYIYELRKVMGWVGGLVLDYSVSSGPFLISEIVLGPGSDLDQDLDPSLTTS